MIPRTIHYCWFGKNPIPEKIEACMASWKRIMPEAKIVRWDETNYDVNAVPYIAAAYRDKKWAFVSDYARLDIIYRYGGIYLDVDVELIKDISPLLNDGAFCASEDNQSVNTGLILAAEPGNELIKEFRDAYLNYSFLDEKGRFSSLPCPKLQTEILYRHGYRPSDVIQRLKEITIYPKEYFSPMDFKTGRLVLTDKSYSIHRWSASWLSPRKRLQQSARWMLARVLPEKVFEFVSSVKRLLLGNL